MRRSGRRAFEDDDAHVALVTKTLRLDEPAWAQVVQRWCDETAPDADVDARLRALRGTFAKVGAPATAPAVRAVCRLCQGEVKACTYDGRLLTGRCEACGHGVLLAGAAPPSVYDARYYEAKHDDGAGYDAYLAEREYREEKGRRLVSRLFSAHGGPVRTLLEVGSGFGFTRAGARSLGLDTAGVDVNPAAVEMARALYGFETTHGTARDVEGVFDLVLYQFVLEHIDDTARELATACARCAPGGLACFVVPSMDAAERDVFGARYRSLRADHLQLFSLRSLHAALTRAGFIDVRVTSGCNLHLLRGFLSQAECDDLYARGLGPDLVATGRRP